MDISAVRKIVEDCCRPMKHALYLNNWHFNIQYEILDGNTAGNVLIQPKYMRATIAIDASKHDDKKEVLDTLRHEMCHIVCGEMELVKELARQPITTEESANALDVVFSHAIEKTVTAMENMLDVIGMESEDLVRKGRKSMNAWTDPEKKKVKK